MAENVFSYILLGVGPVLLFILAKRYEPLNKTALIVLASIAAFPLILFLLYLVVLQNL
jgi:hypothetical protein